MFRALERFLILAIFLVLVNHFLLSGPTRQATKPSLAERAIAEQKKLQRDTEPGASPDGSATSFQRRAATSAKKVPAEEQPQPSSESSSESESEPDVKPIAPTSTKFPLELTAEQHERADKVYQTILQHLHRDLEWQRILSERIELKKSHLLAKPKRLRREVTIYHEHELHMWPHLHYDDELTEEMWTVNCSVPCRVTKDRERADVLLMFWFNDICARPAGMKPHQKTATIFLEPWVGSDVPADRLRTALVEEGGPNYLDIMMSWASHWPHDVPMNYAYGAHLEDHTPLLDNSLTEKQYDAELRAFLHQRFKLDYYPVFDKDLFFNSLSREEVEGPMDMRGGDVAFFVSNCMEGIWRTDYLRLLVELLTADPPFGFGLRVDSFGGCITGLGLNREDIQVGDVTFHGWNFHWDNPRKVEDMAKHFGRQYPRKRKEGSSKGGVVKLEMLDHYKVTLNFENSLIHDYITEKYFEGMASESVAIYFGSTPTQEYVTYDKFGRMTKVRPDMSAPYYPHAKSNIISGWEYPDPREMAWKIHQLCTNEKEWRSHFDWRIPKPGKQIEFRQEFIDMHKEDFVRRDNKNWICRTCEHVASLDY